MIKDIEKKMSELAQDSDRIIGNPSDLEALKNQGPSVKDTYSNGYNAAKAQYGVLFNCFFCGKSIIIDDPDTKKSIAKYLKEQEWGHTECVNNHI